jgi:hypothetical protein
MGARQRWLPALGRRVIAYNAEADSGFECRIVDLETEKTRALPMALFDAHDAGGFGLTLNFSRLRVCTPGYGYGHPKADDGQLTTDYNQNGIFRVDLTTGEAKLILSIEDFLRTNGIAPDLGKHYFTHIQIAPEGRRFAFIHRCYLASGGLVNNFVVANTDGSSSKIVLDDKMSHFDWKDEQRIIIWCRKNAAIKRLKESKLLAVARMLFQLSRKIRINAVRQGLYNECFREINVDSGQVTAVGKGVLVEDGHPQVNPKNSNIWINDTYPDAEFIMTLMLFQQSSGRRVDLLKLPTPKELKDQDWRCDLHPRWHPDGSRVCFDSAHLGRRQICVLDVGKELFSLSR